MSRSTGRTLESRKAYRIFGEDEESSGGDSDLDILKTERKKLDLSQSIQLVTSQQASHTSNPSISLPNDDTDSDPSPRQTSFSKPNSRKRKPPPADPADDTTASASSDKETDFEWPSDDPTVEYLAFKARRTQRRKAAAAETNRIRKAKKSRVAASRAIIGRKKIPPAAQKGSTRRDITGYSAGSDVENGNAEGESKEEVTYLDEPTPEYIEKRRKDLKRLHDAGLRYPPYYDDIEFSDDEDENEEEKPVLHPDIKTQRPKKDILLRESHGIIPAPIAQWLRDYQVDGVEWLHEKCVNQRGAILGDDMGLGKTIQVIAFLTAAFGKSATKRDVKRMRKIRRAGDDRWYPRVLIVCPGTLMQNWEDELQKWGWWYADKFHGHPKDKQGVLNAIRGGRSEIMITTYSTYRNSESEINTIDWDCVIADECHQIKSRNAEITKAMNRVNALCRIGLTGTAIQNKYEELWTLLNWAQPGHYGSAQEWKQTISLPLKIGQAHDATHAQLANARSKANELVKEILPPVFLRRMKTLIAHQLPKKSDRVVFCKLTPTQSKAYKAFIDSPRCEYIRRSREPCDCGSGKGRGWCHYQELTAEDGGGKWLMWMFPAMVTLSKLANHIALLLPQTTDSPEKQAKDLDNLQLACPDKWKELYRMKDSIFNLSQREYCGKWSVLKRLLNFWHQNGDKVLVFSHSVRLLRLLKALFDVDGMKYNWSYLDGSMSLEDRAKAVADFNSDANQFVFLISTKAGGVGLNITSANKVVVMDPNWNPSYDLQAQDRAYRIGQTRDVEVFRLVSSGTIEEIVYARQIYKQQQANIGYTASDERRYFKGVMDSSEKKGELFGLENLFDYKEQGYMLREIVRKTNVAETKAAGVSALDFQPDEEDEEDEEADLLSNQSLGIIDEDGGSSGGGSRQLRRIAERMVGGMDKEKPKPNPINAILAKAGVQYTHENSEVIGRSKMEAKLSRMALEVQNDLELGPRRVFQMSQSQSQSQGLELEYSEDERDARDDVRLVGEGRPGEEFKINYKYRPNEGIRSRQFCSMAKMMGYEDPVEFALVVEDMTQEERISTLEKFYRMRRREIAEEFKGS